MSLPKVIINQLSGNSGRPLEGFNHYTGLMFFGTAPVVSGKWTQYPNTPIIKAQYLFAYSDAADAGIIPFTDNTAASGTYVITNAGTAGDVLEINVEYPLPNSTTGTVNLCSYTAHSGATTIDAQGAEIATEINNGTINHGFTASYASGSDTLTITAPKKYGISLNSGTPIEVIEGGDFAGTLTQFSAGTISNYAIWDYHISEYFRKFPKGVLFVGIISASSSFNEVQSLQIAASGKLRWYGVYDTSGTRGSAANITGTLTQFNTACKVKHDKMPLFGAVYSPNISGVADLSTYPDQNTNSAHLTQCIISQDGDAAGALLYVVSGQTIGNIGAKLATMAKSRVSSSDAQANEDNNLSDGVENNVPAFGNGVLLSNMTENLQEQLDSYRYTFFRQFDDVVTGTYWTGNRTCVSNSNSYANVNDNATIGEVRRILYSTYIPLLNSELYFNADGTLQDYTVSTFEKAGEDAVRAQMITGFGATPLISGIKISIDPTQKVKTTENLIVSCEVIQNGIARTITVNVGYVQSLSS